MKAKNIRHKLLLLSSSTLSMKAFEKYTVKKKKALVCFMDPFAMLTIIFKYTES